MVYGCDPAWWRHRRGLPDFHGLKVAWEGARLDEYPGIHRVTLTEQPGSSPRRYLDDLVTGPFLTLGAGGNSGFQALNLAIQLGARRIVLVGFDMTDRSGIHWYGRNQWPMANNPSRANFDRWVAAFAGAAPLLKSLGADIVNASPDSALACFPKRTLAETLANWS